MGYALEFRSISWLYLQMHLTRPSRDITRLAFDNQWRIYRTGTEAEREWDQAFDELSSAAKANLQSGTETTLSDNAALAFICMVSNLGTLVGSLNHASASGEQFVNDFLSDTAAKATGESEVANLLTSRPLLGLASGEFPAWGGLRQAEISGMVDRFKRPRRELDEDIESWLDDLHDFLKDASSLGTDLVTLYL